jgi:hypothetical protein
MARLGYFEQLADQMDQMQVRIYGDLDARLRIAQRRAKLRELERLERLEQQKRAQGALPMALPEQSRPDSAADTPPRLRRRSRGPSAATIATFAAAFAYLDSGESLEESMSPKGLGDRIADFATERKLEGSELLMPDDFTMRTLMAAGLKAIRHTRGR